MNAAGETTRPLVLHRVLWTVAASSATLLAPFCVSSCAEGDREAEAFMEQRARMVLYDVAGRGVTNESVLAAMGRVPREEYVLPRFRNRAYQDGALPIEAQQTISQPYMVAAMTEAVDPQAGDVVLEVGTGSGYQAAVLAELVHHVYTIEIIESLATSAEARLKRLGYTNITVRAGDGYAGWLEHAPFDGIIVTAAPDHVPPALVEQLRPGGRLVIPVGERFRTQQLKVLEKSEDGSVAEKTLMPVRFVPFTGEGVKSR